MVYSWRLNLNSSALIVRVGDERSSGVDPVEVSNDQAFIRTRDLHRSPAPPHVPARWHRAAVTIEDARNTAGALHEELVRTRARPHERAALVATACCG